MGLPVRAPRWTRFGALVAALATAGCFASATPNPFDDSDPERGQVEIEVENISFNEATVFAVTQARRFRLGVVQGKGSRTFNITLPALQDIEIEIDLLAGQRFQSPVFAVAPGQTLVVQVREPVSGSVVTVRNSG